MKNKVFMIVITALLSVVLISGLLACSKAPAPAPSPSSSPTSAPPPAASPKPSPAPSPSPAATPKPAPPGQIVWRLDTTFIIDEVGEVYLKQAADEILKVSEGRLKIDVYPGGALKLNPANGFSNVRDGLCEASATWTNIAEGEEPSFGVLEGHGIWKSPEQVIMASEALIPFKKKVYEERWNTYFVAPAWNIVTVNAAFTAKKEVRRLDDFKGLKMRTGSVRVADALKEVGMAAQVVPKAELYMGLKTGVLDGLVSAASTVVTANLFDVVKYGVHLTPVEAVVQDIRVNKKAWDALSDDLKRIVTGVFTQYGQRTKMAKLDGVWHEYYVRACQKNGITFATLPPEDLAKIREVALTVQLRFVEKSTPLTKEAWKIVEPIVMGK